MAGRIQAELAVSANTGIRSVETPSVSLVGSSEIAQSDIRELIAANAAERPTAVALAAGAEIVAYAELDERSNQLARHLGSLGVGPDRCVGVGMKRSPAMVIAALAVLNAGGAYLPIDSSLPQARLEFVLRDAGIDVLITDDDSSEKLPKGNWHVVNVSKQAAEIAAHSAEKFLVPVTKDNLSYVIYTSGSTGQPKGVELTHAGLTNLVAWHHRAFQVSPADRASHQAALGFDAAVWEIWPYLVAGASIHIPDESVRNDVHALQQWLISQSISITFLATPVAERMLTLEWPVNASLRLLLTGADTLHNRPGSNLPFKLVNNYGPTECTVVATSGVIDPQSSSAALPTIGRPIDNTRVYILDENLHPVQTGSIGELFVAGAGVARGYRNLPELTAEKFLPDPFSSIPGDRMYRTGDRARQLSNGEIEFVGRIDEQIKIRGFRIEPGEVVRVLNEHPGVEASAVIAASAHGEEQRLIAYVIASPNTTATDLRLHLRKQLPDYMVPTAFVRVGSLPLTLNGKVDKAALPRPGAENILPEDDFVVPQSLVEQRLAPIITSLLHIDKIGANDNFFFLGGHSLLGTQLLTRISQSFGVDLTLLQLFDHPTLAEMSREIEKLILAKLETAASEIPPGKQISQRSA